MEDRIQQEMLGVVVGLHGFFLLLKLVKSEELVNHNQHEIEQDPLVEVSDQTQLFVGLGLLLHLKVSFIVVEGLVSDGEILGCNLVVVVVSDQLLNIDVLTKLLFEEKGIVRLALEALRHVHNESVLLLMKELMCIPTLDDKSVADDVVKMGDGQQVKTVVVVVSVNFFNFEIHGDFLGSGLVELRQIPLELSEVDVRLQESLLRHELVEFSERDFLN